MNVTVNGVKMSITSENKSTLAPKRAFGRVIQVPSANAAPPQVQLIVPPAQFNKNKRTLKTSVDVIKTNEQENYYRPSPLKRTREETDENAREPWDNEKYRKPSKVFPTTEPPKLSCFEVFSPSPVIPYNVANSSSSSDLNSSFTEKISNLNIDVNKPLDLKVSKPQSSKNLKSSSEHVVSALPSGSNKHDQQQPKPDYPFINEIIEYWDAQETKQLVNPAYMARQPEISWKMFGILTDWMVEVTEEYKLQDATLHRAVSYLHRFLSKLQISRGNLQLLGTACIFIGAKIEEITPPETSDLTYVTDNTYTKPQLISMEALVLSTLDFDLLLPTCNEFLEYFAEYLRLNATTTRFARYITDLILLTHEFTRFRPSVIAFGCCYVAIKVCTNSQVNLTTCLSNIPKYDTKLFSNAVERVIQPIYTLLLSIKSSPDTPNSVCNKYPEFQDAATLRSVASNAAICNVTWC